MWSYLRKRRALRRFRRELGPALRRRYGRERFYTPEQVRRTANDQGIGNDHICFAYAMYCDRESFDAHHRAAGEDCDYVAMRADLGIDHAATSHDVIDAGWLVASSDSSCDSGGSFDGGGFDGGGCDGGSD
jgi:hypothetical protein